MTEETTSELLAEIDRDMAEIERQVAELVEAAQQADYPQPEPETTTEQLADISGRDIVRGLVLQVADLIEREEAEIEGQAESTPATEYTPPEGWRVVQVGEPLKGGDEYHAGLDRYIRQIKSQPDPEPQPQPQAEPEPQPNAATIEELRSEVSYVQNLLGTERKRVTQLEKLVASLRTINEAQEKAVEAAGKENTALRNQLLAVKAELASVAADRQRLRIELDAVQQVPADSPELRQLRLDLAEVTLDRDQYKDAYTRLTAFVETVRETAKAEAVEAIVEWLQPIRAVHNEHLANKTLQHLPQIMRHLTGLDGPEDVD